MSAASEPGTTDAAGEGPDRWCYDALEARTWLRGSWQLALLRSLELAWIHFDSNPACFANMVEGEQAIEDFLVGPPAAPTPPALLDEVRAYIRGARAPGSSTWLALELAPGHPPFHGMWWRIDGENPEGCALPGPAAAGVYGGVPAWHRRGMRALVRPGQVHVAVGVSVHGAPKPLELACPVDVAPHVGRQLRIVFDAATSHTAQLVVAPI